MALAKAKLEDELVLFSAYNIKFLRREEDPAMKAMPMHHAKSFRAISKLGRMSWSDFRERRTLDATAWSRRVMTMERVLKLVASVEKLSGTKPSELQWRIDVESIVYDRFRVENVCSVETCKGRLWRSEIEVVSECDSPISSQLKRERRKEMLPCTCGSRRSQSGSMAKDPLFANRVDQPIKHESDDQEKLKTRKPDQVYGLLNTQELLQHSSGASSEYWAFDQREIKYEKQLVFPFLIAEAKSERGNDFQSCQEQTAFPIWRLLKIQEKLATESEVSCAELGGPLVWFFANRGDEWRLYGCYTSTNGLGTTEYKIRPLWYGMIGSKEGALRLLVIMDYIHDWAKDLYRPSIIRQVKAVSAKQARRTRHLFRSKAYLDFTRARLPELDDLRDLDLNFSTDSESEAEINRQDSSSRSKPESVLKTVTSSTYSTDSDTSAPFIRRRRNRQSPQISDCYDKPTAATTSEYTSEEDIPRSRVTLKNKGKQVESVTVVEISNQPEEKGNLPLATSFVPKASKGDRLPVTEEDIQKQQLVERSRRIENPGTEIQNIKHRRNHTSQTLPKSKEKGELRSVLSIRSSTHDRNPKHKNDNPTANVTEPWASVPSRSSTPPDTRTAQFEQFFPYAAYCTLAIHRRRENKDQNSPLSTEEVEFSKPKATSMRIGAPREAFEEFTAAFSQEESKEQEVADTMKLETLDEDIARIRLDDGEKDESNLNSNLKRRFSALSFESWKRGGGRLWGSLGGGSSKRVKEWYASGMRKFGDKN